MGGIKTTLIAEVSNRFERCFIAPENPFTLDNPDLLVAKGRDLFGIYIPTYKETNNVDSLLRRVYLSQLSYGSKLNPILVLNRESVFAVSKACEYSFRHITSDVDDLVNFIDLENTQYQRWKGFSEIQAIQYERYRRNLELSKSMVSGNSKNVFRVDSIPLNDSVIVHSWNTGKEKESRNYKYSQQLYVGLANKGKSTSFKSSLDYLMTLAFMSMYKNDNGELYPTGLVDELGIVNTNWSMFDEEGNPNPYNRMLSFIGLAPVAISTEEEVKTLFDEYFDCYRKTWEYKRK